MNWEVFRAYDIRGVYPTDIDEEAYYRIAKAYVHLFKPKTMVVGMDARVSSPPLKASLIKGFLDAGVDVIDIGEITTDMLYFAVGEYGYSGGVVVSASHNPKEYNGMKMVRREAFPLSGDAGIGEIREMVTSGRIPEPAGPPGSLVRRDLLDDYVAKVLSFIDPAVVKPFTTVLDAGSGMGGLVGPKIFERLPCKTTHVAMEVDGTFPHHESNPLIEENRRTVTQRVLETKADIGIAWDGDADRCFFIDGTGDFVAGDFVTALLAEAFLIKSPGEKILYDVRASYAVKDIVA